MIREKKATGKQVIDLTGQEGNAIALIRRFAKELGKDDKKIIDEMMSGDYENLLTVFYREFGEYVILER